MRCRACCSRLCHNGTLKHETKSSKKHMKTLCNLFLTLSLLATTREPAAWELLCIKSELQGLLIAAEVMDARESQYVFAKPGEIADDARFIRRRIEDLQNAPHSDAHLMFAIDRSAINDLLTLNSSHRNWLEGVEPLYPGQHRWGVAIDEAKLLYQAWDCLRDAKSPHLYIHVRRKALKQLHELIGAKAFDHGLMPPPLPNWRMTEIR